MRRIAIIPARGGSKRIPRKNIKSFASKPMIAHSILAAMKSELFDIVMVSTDDEEIAQVSKQYGAQVPFLRSAENSDDFSGTGDVMHEVLSEYKRKGLRFNIACCIYATAPLISVIRLQEALRLLETNDFDATLPLGRYASPIWRSYHLTNNNGIDWNFPAFEAKRSQDLKQTFFDAGQFYWFYPNNLEYLENKNSFGKKKGGIILEDYEVQDIDEPSDWDMAELKYKYLKSRVH